MRVKQLDIAIFVYVILICLCFLNPGLSAALDPDAALGIWFFDDGNGNTAKDTSKNGNDGDIDGAQWVDGKFGGALKFEGGAHVAVGDFADYQDKVSIVALIKTAAAPRGLISL